MGGDLMPDQLTDKMKAFLSEVFPAVIALKRPNGSIQVIPVWFEYRDGYFSLNSATSRRCPQHLHKAGEVENAAAGSHRHVPLAEGTRPAGRDHHQGGGRTH
jgi:hypothetical protein